MLILCIAICFVWTGEVAHGLGNAQNATVIPGSDISVSQGNLTENATTCLNDTVTLPPMGDVLLGGRAKTGKLFKGKLWSIAKALLLMKVLLFAVSLPLSAVTAKILSWKAVSLSLLAFATSTLVLIRSLFSGQSRQPPTSPPTPIIIQSSSDPVRSLRAGPKIFIQPDFQAPDVEEDGSKNKRWRLRRVGSY